MAKPQDPNLRRSGRTESLDPDNTATRLEAEKGLTRSGRSGPVPPENRPGHHPDHEQDQPDLDDFVERFQQAGRADAAHEPPGRSGPTVVEPLPADAPPLADASTLAPGVLGRGAALGWAVAALPLRCTRAAAALALRRLADVVQPPLRP